MCGAADRALHGPAAALHKGQKVIPAPSGAVCSFTLGRDALQPGTDYNISVDIVNFLGLRDAAQACLHAPQCPPAPAGPSRACHIASSAALQAHAACSGW